MLPVSSAELLSIQSELASAVCNLPCVIQRKIRTPDGSGSSSETYATISPNGLLAGLGQPSQQLLQNYGYRLESLNTWLVKLPYGTTVGAQDHLLIAGNTLEAHVVLDPRSYPGLTLVLCAQLKP